MVRKITKWHIMIPFLGDYSRNVILADIERELDVSHQTLKKYADLLVKNGLLVEERKPRNILYRINTENSMVLNYLSTSEKIILEERLEKSMILKRLYEVLSPDMKDNIFLIFGSSVKGKIGEDIDLLACGTGEISDKITSFEKTYGKKIHLLQVPNLRIQKTLFNEIMKEHIIMNSFDYFIKSFWEFTWKK